LAEKDDRRHLFSYLERRFGISQTHFADYLLFRKKRSWFLIRDTRFIPAVSQLKVTQAGLRAFQRVGGFVKPTTRFIQSFGRFATRAKLHIDMAQLQALLRGEKIHVDITLDNGYVILAIGGDSILGIGLYIDGMVSSQLPGKEIRSAML
jgi:NOL1/NOP2/fmu family ribosome biogenesis protein